MGYTNYWTVDDHKKKFSEEFKEIAESIIKLSGVKIADWDGEKLNEWTLTDTEINLNGYKEEQYENFRLSINANTDIPGSSCCKTAREPYDKVVKALLMLALDYGHVTRWDFDGSKDDIEYTDAFELYTSIVKLYDSKKEQ